MTKLSVDDLLDATVAALNDAESRPGQASMAREISSAIATGRHLIAQAGTGTGKSLGYLVPVALSAKRAVVANVRMLSRLVQGTASVTPAQKQDLGLKLA